MKWIDRFCAKHPHFGIDNLMKVLIVGNAIIWILSMFDSSGFITGFLTLNPAMIMKGQIWRLVSWIFIPDSQGLWAVLFLYFYFFIGNTLEQQWGTAKFTCYILCGMIFTIVYDFIVYFTGINMTVGASYIYLSMFFAYATFYPDTQVLLFFFIPLKIKWLAIIDALFFVVSIVQTSMPAKLLPVIALLNFFLFCGDSLFGFLKPARRAQRKKTINYRKEAQKVKEEQAQRGYRFQCAVCGRTDKTNPELEFRYCSKCAGYHCFCQDHINSHVHFMQ